MPSPLLSLILERIRTQGPITVAEFIDQALYNDPLGYYSSEHQRSGREGDFFTSVDLGPVFGELLATQFAEMSDLIDGGRSSRGRPFDLVEAAAGNGRLARDILAWAAVHRQDFYHAVQLHLVDRSPRARARQLEQLGVHAPRLASSSSELPDRIRGVVYANELLDALPPHLVVMREGGLRELYVDRAAGNQRGEDVAAAAAPLRTVEGPPSSPGIAAYLERVGARLEPGWFAEVNLAAADWVCKAAGRLERGFLVLVDYGHEAARLYSASHAGGTLASYRRHASESREDGPGWLLEPGERDITSHVDLTGVVLAARDAGMTWLGTVDRDVLPARSRPRRPDGGRRRPGCRGGQAAPRPEDAPPPGRHRQYPQGDGLRQGGRGALAPRALARRPHQLDGPIGLPLPARRAAHVQANGAGFRYAAVKMNTTPLEREVKLRFSSPAEARDAILAIGVTPLRGRRLQEDCLLDTVDERLRQQRSVLRIRVEAGRSLLTYKGPVQPSRWKLREERETIVSDGETILYVLERLGFSVWFRYQKYREEFGARDAVVALDETPIGTFVEIEGSEAAIVELTAALGRSDADFIVDSYRSLYVQHCEARGITCGDMVFEE